MIQGFGILCAAKQGNKMTSRVPLKIKTRRKLRTRNPVETRAKLLQATIDLITEKGPDALSLKEAARRANVSRGVAYLHFVDRAELLHKATSWISDQLQEGVKRFDPDAPLHDRTVYSIKLVLEHPEASRLMIAAAMAGQDLDRRHPLYKLVVNRLKELRRSGKVRNDLDIEILGYIMFGSIAATIMLGAHRKGDDVDELAERFTNEWDRILEEGIFLQEGAPGDVTDPPPQARVPAKTAGRRNDKR
jgi:AcrR family transcriptional regulator